MNKISCEICLDLIPLVNDDIASEDSKDAVREHIKECKSCRSFCSKNHLEEHKMDDARIVSKMKNELYFIALIVIIFGAMLGIALTDGMGIFYNILIMPTIGMIGYFTLSKKSYLVPLILFGFMYVFMLIKYTT
ncbi:MAG: zf-HC2 domain-containing protein, partial [Tissierellia bacterium]|nr:zf-HC2 domain-containing protein [Tissierellia bacterium]